VSSLGATPPENLPAVRRAHPFAKAVAAFPLASIRLIRPLHGPSSRWKKKGIILPLPFVCQALQAVLRAVLCRLGAHQQYCLRPMASRRRFGLGRFRPSRPVRAYPLRAYLMIMPSGIRRMVWRANGPVTS
jgi:hypothetical protein